MLKSDANEEWVSNAELLPNESSPNDANPLGLPLFAVVGVGLEDAVVEGVVGAGEKESPPKSKGFSNAPNEPKLEELSSPKLLGAAAVLVVVVVGGVDCFAGVVFL